MAHEYDAVVVGLGTMGSQVLWRLAQAGWRVLGIDRDHPPHHLGSHHGWSRLIRFAYFEHPNYVPLLLEAERGWSELERASGRTLFERCGVIQGGPPRSPLIRGIIASAERHRLDVEPLDIAARERLPFSLPPTWTVLMESGAGYLHPELCIETALLQAEQCGAEMCTGQQVTRIDDTADWLELHTPLRHVRAKRIVLTTGAFASDWRDWNVHPPTVLRKHLFWFQPRHATSWHVRAGCPAFLFDVGESYIYGFPAHDERGVKLARHDGGMEIDPASEDTELGRLDELASVQKFIDDHAPGLRSEPSEHAICRYAMSEDGDFRLGVSARDSRVVWASCFSGHGFKFAPAIGTHIAHRLLESKWRPEVQFLVG